jgi:glycosyltransferase involved in cell wall biosynthesis
MRFLFVFHDRANYVGGPAVNIARLLPKLQQMGHEVAALCVWSGKRKAHPNADSLIARGIDCRFHRRTTYYEPLVRWTLRQAADIGPDVFVPNISTQACFAGRWLKRAGIPVINTCRSPDELNTGRAWFFSRGPEEWRTSGVVCVNGHLQDELLADQRDHIPSRVIPSGVEVPSAMSSQTGDVLRVAYSGRLVERQKRLSDMLEGFFSVCEANPRISFTVIGDGAPGSLERYWSMVQRAGYGDRIRFTGQLLGEEYERELLAHHVVVLLSDYEGMPGSLIDGMARGLVPLCTDIPGIRELVEPGRTGILVEDRFGSLVRILDRLQRDAALRSRLGKAARERIRQDLTLGDVARRWIEFAEELLRDAGPRLEVRIPRNLNLPPNDPLLREHRRSPLPLRLLGSLLSRFQSRSRAQGRD